MLRQITLNELQGKFEQLRKPVTEQLGLFYAERTRIMSELDKLNNVFESEELKTHRPSLLSTDIQSIKNATCIDSLNSADLSATVKNVTNEEKISKLTNILAQADSLMASFFADDGLELNEQLSNKLRLLIIEGIKGMLNQYFSTGNKVTSLEDLCKAEGLGAFDPALLHITKVNPAIEKTKKAHAKMLAAQDAIRKTFSAKQLEETTDALCVDSECEIVDPKLQMMLDEAKSTALTQQLKCIEADMPNLCRAEGLEKYDPSLLEVKDDTNPLWDSTVEKTQNVHRAFHMTKQTASQRIESLIKGNGRLSGHAIFSRLLANPPVEIKNEHLALRFSDVLDHLPLTDLIKFANEMMWATNCHAALEALHQKPMTETGDKCFGDYLRCEWWARTGGYYYLTPISEAKKVVGDIPQKMQNVLNDLLKLEKEAQQELDHSQNMLPTLNHWCNQIEALKKKIVEQAIAQARVNDVFSCQEKSQEPLSEEKVEEFPRSDVSVHLPEEKNSPIAVVSLPLTEQEIAQKNMDRLYSIMESILSDANVANYWGKQVVQTGGMWGYSAWNLRLTVFGGSQWAVPTEIYYVRQLLDKELATNNGYDFALMTSQPLKLKMIEWQLVPEGVQYRVMGLDNAEKTDTILWKELPNYFPQVTKDNIAEAQSQVLKDKSVWLPIFLDAIAKKDKSHVPHIKNEILTLVCKKIRDTKATTKAGQALQNAIKPFFEGETLRVTPEKLTQLLSAFQTETFKSVELEDKEVINKSQSVESLPTPTMRKSEEKQDENEQLRHMMELILSDDAVKDFWSKQVYQLKLWNWNITTEKSETYCVPTEIHAAQKQWKELLVNANTEEVLLRMCMLFRDTPMTTETGKKLREVIVRFLGEGSNTLFVTEAKLNALHKLIKEDPLFKPLHGVMPLLLTPMVSSQSSRSLNGKK